MRARVMCVLWIVLLFGICGKASPQEAGTGLGVVLGEPTGFSLKTWTGPRSAFDVAVAWSFGNRDALHVHADYLIHDFGLFHVEKGKLVLFYGIGGRVKAEKKTRAGLRFPVGIAYLVETHPIEVFFEVGPIFDIAPETAFRLTGGLGVRYFF